jgi:plastocyanin
VQATGFFLLALGSYREGVAAEDQPPGSQPDPTLPLRPRVPQPRIALEPAAIDVAPGSRVQFFAHRVRR